MSAEGRPHVYVGRQPIFNRDLAVVGYELLFRDGVADRADVDNHEGATASVITGALTEIGIERLVGEHAAWVNVSREFVLSGLVETMPARLTVLEILEGQTVDEQLIEAVAELRSQGFRIALDDFDSAQSANALLPVADIVKLDVQALGPEGVAEHVRALAPHNVTLLAEKVETHEEYAWAREAGCRMFQGYFFCRPEVVRDRKVAAGRQSLLQFISTLQDQTVEFNDLTEMIARDVALSYRLLRYVNSAFFGLRCQVSSITQALVLLGVENLRRWATLSLFASVDAKPQELTVTALLRARFCELAGAVLPDVSAGELFTLGLFSVVDALIDCPIEEVMESTPFPDEMRQALITHRGVRGRPLACVVCLEAGRPVEADALVNGASELYLEAITWVNEAVKPLFAEIREAAAV